MRAAKMLGVLLVIMLVLLLAAGLIGLMGKVLISGANHISSWGDVPLSEQEAGTSNEEVETFSTEPPGSTVPPGDDPSWSQPMDSYPVDKTADELAENP